MILVQTTDFVGTYAVALSVQNTPLLQSYIDRYEADFIRKIMGSVQGNDFIADKSNPTQAPEYAVIEQPFQIEGTNGCEHSSKGLKDCLIAMIFYKYIFETQTRHAQAGVTLNVAEVSNINSPENAARYGEQRWNAALETIEAIQWYCSQYMPDDYPDFNGQTIEPEYSAFL